MSPKEFGTMGRRKACSKPRSRCASTAEVTVAPSSPGGHMSGCVRHSQIKREKLWMHKQETMTLMYPCVIY